MAAEARALLEWRALREAGAPLGNRALASSPTLLPPLDRPSHE